MAGESVIAALEAAVAAAPDDLALRAHLCELLTESGRHSEALAHAGYVLERDPAHIAALRAASASGRALADPRTESWQRLLAALDASGNAEHTRDYRDVPDTADELLATWDESAPLKEVTIGEITVPGATLADVAGMKHVKQQLERSFLNPMRNPELQAQFGKSLRGGLLLWGPPGCGKTFLARALAGELGASFYDVGLSDVLDMYIGNSEKNVSNIFEVARRAAPCVLFLDEVDALGVKRSQTRGTAMRNVVNQLLAEMDGVSSDNEGVFVLGATNHPWDIDTALVRPGRFDRKLLVLPPDRDARTAIVEYHLRGRPTTAIDAASIAKDTEGLSGADLALICESAVEAALERSIEAGTVQPITQSDMKAARAAVRSSIKPWLDTASNYVRFNNSDGSYDELAAYLRTSRR